MGIQREGTRQGPRWNYFLGQATCHLHLPHDVTSEKELTLRLESNPDIVDRKIKGSITVKYTWTPNPQANSDQAGPAPSESISQLHGALQVTIVSGHGLLNLVNQGKARKSASSPYCCVYVYPTRPAEDAILTPAVWHTSTCVCDLSPIWDETDTFMYEWKRPDLSARTCCRESINPFSPIEQSLEPDDKMLDETLMALQILKNEMNCMKEETKNLKAVVDQKELQATGSGIARTQAVGEESDDGEVQQSEGDLSSVAPEDEESV